MATWVTHWMSKDRKVASDCDYFCEEYILKRKSEILTREHYSFLLGYYIHLNADENLRARAKGYSEDWDSEKN